MNKRLSAFAVISASLLIYYLVMGVLVVTKENPANGGMDYKSHEQELTEANWRTIFEDEWMVEFYAPWCPACKSLTATWSRFANTAHTIGVNVAKIDVTKSPSLSGRFIITALPTIYHVINGELRQYRGARELDALMSFITEKQWQKVERISDWKRPDTIHMSILSYFFKLSHTLKDFNTRLQEDYGLPIWGSYGMFAIGTVFIGAALGLMLVCIVDFLYPPKKLRRQSFTESKGKDYSAVEDIAYDEIEDDAPGSQNDDDDANDDGDDMDDDDDDDDDDDNNNSDENENDGDDKDEVATGAIDEHATGDQKSTTTNNDLNSKKTEKADENSTSC